MALTYSQLRRSSMIAAVAVCATFLAACGGSSEGGGENTVGSDEFPASEFPESSYGGLSGDLVLYDVSGGTVSEGRDSTVNKRFSDLTGVSFKSDFNDGNAKFFASAEAGQVPWSAIEISSRAQLVQATEQGLLAKIDTDVVKLDKLEDGTYTDYAIPEQLYGTVLVYNKDTWPDSGKQPETIEDLYNTADFPGKRCLPKDPGLGAPGVFESALLSAGTSVDDLYPFDLDTAFGELDTIKDDIVWWTDGDSSVRFMTTGECDMGLVWSARAFAAISDDAPLDVVWKNTVVSNAYYAVPKDAPNVKAGMAFLAMQLDDTKGQIELVNKVPYPMPLKGIPVTEYSEEVQPFLPVGENYSVALPLNGDYYAEALPELQKAFNSWLIK